MALTSWYRTGTIAVTNGSPNVTGSGTQWDTADVRAGDSLWIPSRQEMYEISSVTAETTIILATNYSGSTASGLSYAVIPGNNQILQLPDALRNLIDDFVAVLPMIAASINGATTETGSATDNIRLAAVSDIIDFLSEHGKLWLRLRRLAQNTEGLLIFSTAATEKWRLGMKANSDNFVLQTKLGGGTWQDAVTINITTGKATFAYQIADDAGNLLVGVPRRNLIVNPYLRWWQRGTSFTAANNLYFADQWQLIYGSGFSTSSFTVSQQTLSASDRQSVPPFLRNYARLAMTGANATGFCSVRQYVKNNGWGAGEKINFSAYCRSSVAGVLAISLYRFQDGVRTLVSNNNVSVTSAWGRFETTFTVPNVGFSDNTKFEIAIGIIAVATGTLNFDLTGIQMEVGNSATQLETIGEAEDFVVCRYYYQKSYPQGTAPGTPAIATGAINRPAISTNHLNGFEFPKMVVAPTLTILSPTSGSSGKVISWNGGADIGSGIVGLDISESNVRMLDAGASTFTANSFYRLHYTLEALI